MTEEEILTTAESGKILELSPERVRQLEREGRLRAMRTASGQRIFRREDVERLRKQREAGGTE